MAKLIASGVVCLSLFCAFAEPKTIYVDQKVETSGDGTSWDTAVKTIQEGVNKASTTEVDTILVAPGEYADEPGVCEPTSAGKYVHYRVKLDRKVILKADKGKEVTHIVGRRGDGQGNNDPTTDLPPVMCVYIPAAGQGSIVEGFTIRDGEVSSAFGTAVRSAGVGDPAKTSNGDYYLKYKPQEFWYVAYCTISNCCAGRGSAVSGGTLINSVIADNRSWNSTVATTYVHAYNTLFTRNSTTTTQGAQAYVLINCLVIDDGTQRGMIGVPNDQTGDETKNTYSMFYNSAIYDETTSANSWSTPICSHCILDSTDGVNMNIHADSNNNTPIRITAGSYTAYYTNLVISACTGDYRPVKGGLLDGKGDANAINRDFIPEQYRGRDFNGNPLATDAPVPIGLILPTAEPATAPLVVGEGMKINGQTVVGNNHAHYEATWPAIARFTALDGEADRFVGVSVGPYLEEVGYRKFCGKYDFAPVTLPPRLDADGEPLPALTVSKLVANAGNVLWVDDDATFEGEADGSEDKPYRTIQAAVDKATENAATLKGNTPFYIINVRAGTYNNGETADPTGIKARVIVPHYGNLIIRGVDGAAKTFVEGAPDSTTLEDEEDPGIGPNACRCFYLYSNADVALVDLTIRKGYGGLTSGSGSGGGVYCGASGGKHQLYDCVLTENHIVKEHATETATKPKLQLQGSCCVNGWMVRCVIKDSTHYNRGVFKDSTATACQFLHNARTGVTSSYLWQQGTAYLSTVYEPQLESKVGNIFNSSGAWSYYNVLLNGYIKASAATTAAEWAGNIAYGQTSVTSHPETEIKTIDPELAAIERDDFHPIEGSPVVGYVEFSTSTDKLGARLRNICTDFENKSVFTSGGKFTIGAFATVHPKTDIYVDAENGDDENDGKTTDAAKKTLAKAVEALCRKDRIVALPGTYKDGEMTYSVRSTDVTKPITVRARVVVPDGSELVAQGSAEETIIAGEADPTPTGTTDEVTYGLGPNAMRGVVLGAGSVLRGFTVTQGRTRGYDTTEGYSDNVHGAGVLGRSHELSRVENCIFTNNYGACGGAGAYVTFDHCVMLDNIATKFGSVLRNASMIDSFADGNRGDRVCELIADVIGCTFGAGNLRPDGGGGTMLVCNADLSRSAHVWNTLSYALPVRDHQVNNGDIRNCVFPKGVEFTHADGTTLDVDTETVNVELTQAELAKHYDENGAPKSVFAPSVDKGTSNEFQNPTDLDLAGNPRMANRVIDIGCYEADWKDQYARDLGRTRATVTEATLGVQDVDGRVELLNGDSLKLTLNGKGTSEVEIAFTVTDGTLTVTRNGESCETYTEGQTLTLKPVADSESFVFSYKGRDGGNATLTSCRARPAFMLFVH